MSLKVYPVYTVCTRHTVQLPQLPRVHNLPQYRNYSKNRSNQTKMKPETVHSRILYNDDRILVYNKPNRKAVHNGPKVGKTIYQQLEEANVTPVYPVHRLDRDTTGCLLFAKDQEMANYLSNLMKHHRVLRSYLALCIGIPEQTKGEVGGIIGHFNRNGRWQMGMTKRITSNNRDTVSKYRVLKTYLDAMSMMELQPVTGAKHQLKVHCAQLLKTPIFGDNKYAPKALHHSDLAQRLTGQSWGWNPVHLHAHRILIPEYKQTNDLVITAPLPTYFLATLMRIESYTFHRTRTAPQKDRTVDRVDEGFLQKLTGMSARESFYDINATMPEEDQDLQDMSYAEEDMYKRSRKDLTRSFSSSKGKQHLKINNMMRRTVSKNSER